MHTCLCWGGGMGEAGGLTSEAICLMVDVGAGSGGSAGQAGVIVKTGGFVTVSPSLRGRRQAEGPVRAGGQRWQELTVIKL